MRSVSLDPAPRLPLEAGPATYLDAVILHLIVAEDEVSKEERCEGKRSQVGAEQHQNVAKLVGSARERHLHDRRLQRWRVAPPAAG